MFVLAEFELFEDEDMVLALPFELEGGTEGTARTRQDALELRLLGHPPPARPCRPATDKSCNQMSFSPRVAADADSWKPSGRQVKARPC